jgi:hypothetical protein
MRARIVDALVAVPLFAVAAVVGNYVLWPMRHHDRIKPPARAWVAGKWAQPAGKWGQLPFRVTPWRGGIMIEIEVRPARHCEFWMRRRADGVEERCS